MSSSTFDFSVLTGHTVQNILVNSRTEIINVVRDAYLLHHQNQTVNPDSYFLRFPDNPNSRIIALPAAIRGEEPFSGIKWIASYPQNVEQGIPRASAVLILNNYTTGYPYVCMEASLISAARTAASAALAARTFADVNRPYRRVAFVGSGIIARNILDFLVADGLKFDELTVYDLSPKYGQAFLSYAENEYELSGTLSKNPEDAISGTELVVLATTAATPYIVSPQTFNARQVVLNISLRDLSPEIILSSWNVLDDIGHCLKADTSPHLAEKMVNHRKFIHGTLAEYLHEKVELNTNKPIIFSPFGLGILDLAVGAMAYDKALASGDNLQVNDFFYERERWE